MPTSDKQQRFMRLVLAVKRKRVKKEVGAAARRAAGSMTEKQVREFATGKVKKASKK